MREKHIDFGFAIHSTTHFASRRLVASGQFESHAVIALLDSSKMTRFIGFGSDLMMNTSAS